MASYSYACLDSETYSQPPTVYPFDQIILEDRYQKIDPKWEGSCGYLSRAWMCQKILLDSVCDPTVFQLQNKEIIILGDNDPQGEDIQRIQSLFRSAFDKFRERRFLTVEYMESRYQSKGMGALLSFLKSYRDDDNGMFFFETHREKVVEGPEGKYFKSMGHLCGFFKKGRSCAWFDPNLGEVAFENYKDFILWFEAETTNGVLRSYQSMRGREAGCTFSISGSGEKRKIRLANENDYFKNRRHYTVELVSELALAVGGIEVFRKEYASNPIPFLAE